MQVSTLENLTDMWCLKLPRSMCFIYVSSDQVSRGFGSEFRFSEATSGGNAAADPFDASAGGADNDDLYN
nr:cell division cycle protein 48 homolog [Tanacetum cinerariifolium]